MAKRTASSAAPFVPQRRSLTAIRAALPACTGCQLYRHATQVVPGEGLRTAHLMLVGEEPGNQEDLAGRPFVGPAGRLLRRLCDDLGIDTKAIYITNAVKHFKFAQQGTTRRNLNPLASEINACRPWLEAEIDALRPTVILCLGASAAKSLLGSGFRLMQDRGTFLPTQYAEHTMATVHPSAVLRAYSKEARERLQGFLKEDIALAYQTSARLVSKATSPASGAPSSRRKE